MALDACQESPRINLRLMLTSLVLALLAAACGGTVSPTPTATLTPGPAPQVVTTRLLALTTGQLMMVKGCLRLAESDGSGSLLLIWPEDITATVSGETVQVTDLLEKKQATWYLGDIVPVGGGHIPSVGAGLQHIGPADCPGPYYVVSGVYPSASPTPGVTRTPAPTPQATLTPTPGETVQLASAVALQIVSTHAGPSIEYDVLGELQPGQTYPVIGQRAEWWEVELANGLPAWVVKDVMAFSGDERAVPVVSPPATSTVPPGVSQVAQDGIVTFTSTTLGLSFSYLPAQHDGLVRTRLIGERVYVFYINDPLDSGQYVQVFQKAPGDTLAQAIRKQILAGYDPHDCSLLAPRVPDDSGAPRPPTAVYAMIVPNVPPTVHPSDDGVATEMAQAQKCPPVYTVFGGSVYFMEDTRYPDRYFFFKIGQYWIYGASPPLSGQYGYPWQDTLQVTAAHPAPAGTAAPLAERHQTLPSGLTIDEYALKSAPSLDPLNFETVQSTRADIVARHRVDGGKFETVDSFFDQTGPAMSIKWGGQTLVAQQVFLPPSLATGDLPSLSMVEMQLGAQTLYTLPVGYAGPIDNLRNLLAYDRHWLLEAAYVSPPSDSQTGVITDTATGQIVQDGVLLNTRDRYQEAFGLQLIHGKLFYFFKKDGQIGASYDGYDTPLGYDAVAHYGCCSGAEMNPVPRENMVSFFARRGEAWYYVEIGNYG